MIATGVVPQRQVAPGTAVAIATGGMLPRGADAVVMVEHTDVEGGRLLVRRAVTPGFGVSFAGTDIAAGETVLRRGRAADQPRDGRAGGHRRRRVAVWRRPRVAILSTGDEIIEPGEPMRPGQVYDSNARILADAVRELGGEPRLLGIVRDDAGRSCASGSHAALAGCDVVLLSGGTSKGAGDLSYRVVARTARSGHRGPRRGAEAGQADLPGGAAAASRS